MEFQLIGPDLEIKATEPDDIRELIEAYKLDIFQVAAQVQARELVHLVKAGRSRDHASWFAAQARLSGKWLEPYWRLLERITGFRGPMPEIEAPRFPDYVQRDGHICPTHIVVRATVGSEGYWSEGFVHTADWQGRPAELRAEPYYTECVQKGVGQYRDTPQYLPADEWGYTFRPNPEFGKYHPPIPAKSPERLATRLWETIFHWWWHAHATPEQAAFLEACERQYHVPCPRSSLASSLMRSYPGKLDPDYSKRDSSLTFEQFQKLGK